MIEISPKGASLRSTWPLNSSQHFQIIAQILTPSDTKKKRRSAARKMPLESAKGNMIHISEEDGGLLYPRW